MLIEFSVTNYRSIGERQVLSLLPATNQKDYQENILDIGGHKALNIVAIYGANASGKSNLLMAMGEFLSLVTRSANRASTKNLKYDPFLLREGWETKPTTFEAAFSIAKIRYRYSFSYYETHILSESLLRKGSGREVKIFQREKGIIDPSSALKGNQRVIDAAIEATRENALFLATMDMLNIEIASVIFQFFDQALMVDGMNTGFFGKMKSVWEGNIIKQEVTNHLIRLKLGLIEVEAKKNESSHLGSNFQDYQVLATHKFYDSSGKPTEKLVTWDYFERESSGSVKALEMGAPVLAILKFGGILIIDEIEAKMHPLLTLDTINLFLSKETNPNNAQLIFSTHDTNLLSYASLRRDQIYFAEKNDWESTEIYSLSDFVYVNASDGSQTKERLDTDKEKRYLEGRYGAVPVLGPRTNLKRILHG